jgi:glycosyltransferase involved in cell wall biosynthesis
MSYENSRVRVLYSFPHRIGHERICYTAWQQVYGLAVAGAEVILFPASVHRPFPAGLNIQILPTLAQGRIRLPFRVLGGMRTFALHDWIVAGRLERLAGKIDIIHTWPLGARHTLKAAAKLGIPTVLERCNAHTGFAYEAVKKECERLGVTMPAGHEHTYNIPVLRKEEEEYRLTDYLLCPSDFVVRTFVDYGFPAGKLVRHVYGYDASIFFPRREKGEPSLRRGLNMLFVGGCAPRKGLHYALEAWLASPAHKEGTFSIAGGFIPGYAERLAEMLSHPSVRMLGARSLEEVTGYMRESDILVLPSIEEGFGLVCAEAMGSGCVPLVSDACTDECRHMENAMVHRVGDVEALTQHLTMLHEDWSLLEKLRAGALRTAPGLTWEAAGHRLLQAYRVALARHRGKPEQDTASASPAAQPVGLNLNH